jgi:uncharacterized Ntn-hydrolase superfamily protein
MVRQRHGISVAGNMLSGEPTVAATLAAWQANPALEVPERLMAAMEAGEAAGGDRRGRQSAAMVLVTTEDFPDLNLRVDDSTAPLPELRRLLGIWRVERAPGLAAQPSRANPAGYIDLDTIEAGWIGRGLDLRFRR